MRPPSSIQKSVNNKANKITKKGARQSNARGSLVRAPSSNMGSLNLVGALSLDPLESRNVLEEDENQAMSSSGLMIDDVVS